MNSYNKYTITTTEEAEELIISSLSDIGIDSVEIVNSQPVDDVIQGANYEELQPDITVEEGVSVISFYTEYNESDEELMSNVRDCIDCWNGVVDLGVATLERELVKDSDYDEKWKEFFQAFTIGNLLIRPTWEKETTYPTDGQMVINIDPGMSFGTGKHETTYLCIEDLQDFVKPGMKVLDIGCGSGILSIVSKKLGAGQVYGIDIDPDCITSSQENYEINDLVFEPDDFVAGNLIEDDSLCDRFVAKGPYDIIVANLLADIIIPMLPQIRKLMTEKTVLITSGIIDFKQQAVADAMTANGMTVMHTKDMGDWCLITASTKC